MATLGFAAGERGDRSVDVRFRLCMAGVLQRLLVKSIWFIIIAGVIWVLGLVFLCLRFRRRQPCLSLRPLYLCRRRRGARTLQPGSDGHGLEGQSVQKRNNLPVISGAEIPGPAQVNRRGSGCFFMETRAGQIHPVGRGGFSSFWCQIIKIPFKIKGFRDGTGAAQTESDDRQPI